MQSRREAGFSFIEIMVVMGIITVLVSMVVVVIPTITEKANQTKSKDNVKSIITMYLAEGTAISSWPPANGKAFVLWAVASGKIDKRTPKNLEVLFSPGDGNYTLENAGVEAYGEVTKQALKDGTQDFAKLTSYAGRRNKEREHKISADDVKRGVIVICDDDDGPLHHPGGLVVGYTNSRVEYLDWDALGVDPPENEKEPTGLLGDSAQNDELKHLSSGN
jgi:type II secretory pathway pseudopilin PulG